MHGISSEGRSPTLHLCQPAYQQQGAYHFITFSCHDRLPFLQESGAYELLEQKLEELRKRHEFHVIAYVFMPEHIHLLLSEPAKTPLSAVIKAFKQETSKKLRGTRKRFWLPRYYDFNVLTWAKRQEKLDYIHHNPVKRGLVEQAEDWRWSSKRYYLLELSGNIHISG